MFPAAVDYCSQLGSNMCGRREIIAVHMIEHLASTRVVLKHKTKNKKQKTKNKN